MTKRYGCRGWLGGVSGAQKFDPECRPQTRTWGARFSAVVGLRLERILLVGLLQLNLLSAQAASPAQGDESLRLLGQMAQAAHELSYQGVFVFEHEGDFKSSRVAHALENGKERARIDTLDGPRREIVRQDDEVRCYFPDAHRLRYEHGANRRLFPALIQPPLADYLEYYDISLRGEQRVAGRTCQTVLLRPRDGYRLGHELCADSKTHLLLRETTLGPNGEPVKFSAFTEIMIGPIPSQDLLRPAFSDTAGWRTERTPRSQAQAQAQGEDAWVVTQLPAGFHKIREVQRHGGRMIHLVYTDGLSNVSVFIEPVEGSGRPDLTAQLSSALSYYSSRQADHQITVVGEIPVLAATQIGKSVVQLRGSHP